jgi:hemolysin activation/secretion protein
MALKLPEHGLSAVQGIEQPEQGEKFKTQYDFFIATPIAKPNNFHSDALNLGMSLKWRI